MHKVESVLKNETLCDFKIKTDPPLFFNRSQKTRSSINQQEEKNFLTSGFCHSSRSQSEEKQKA